MKNIVALFLLSACGSLTLSTDNNIASSTDSLTTKWSQASEAWALNIFGSFSLSQDKLFLYVQHNDDLELVSVATGKVVHTFSAAQYAKDGFVTSLSAVQSDGLTLLIALAHNYTTGQSVLTTQLWGGRNPHTQTLELEGNDLPPNLYPAADGSTILIGCKTGMMLWTPSNGNIKDITQDPAGIVDPTHILLAHDDANETYSIQSVLTDEIVPVPALWGASVKLSGANIYVLDDNGLTLFDLQGQPVKSMHVSPGLKLLGVNEGGTLALLGSSAITLLIALDDGVVLKGFEGQYGYWNAEFPADGISVIFHSHGEIQKWTAAQICQPSRVPGGCI